MSNSISFPAASSDSRVALVLGGTGAVGRAVLHELSARGITTTFTYHTSTERAAELSSRYGFPGLPVDFADATATSALFAELDRRGFVPDVLIHCTAVSQVLPLAEVTPSDFARTLSVNAQSAFLACQWLAARRPSDCDVVFVGALTGSQSLPLPVPYAATQGMLPAMVMALAHELGPRRFRINLAALGLLDEGLSQTLDPKRRADYLTFSALRRVGSPRDAASSIVWLALENRAIHGKVVALNGGI